MIYVILDNSGRMSSESSVEDIPMDISSDDDSDSEWVPSMRYRSRLPASEIDSNTESEEDVVRNNRSVREIVDSLVDDDSDENRPLAAIRNSSRQNRTGLASHTETSPSDSSVLYVSSDDSDDDRPLSTIRTNSTPNSPSYLEVSSDDSDEHEQRSAQAAPAPLSDSDSEDDRYTVRVETSEHTIQVETSQHTIRVNVNAVVDIESDDSYHSIELDSTNDSINVTNVSPMSNRTNASSTSMNNSMAHLAEMEDMNSTISEDSIETEINDETMNVSPSPPTPGASSDSDTDEISVSDDDDIWVPEPVGNILAGAIAIDYPDVSDTDEADDDNDVAHAADDAGAGPAHQIHLGLINHLPIELIAELLGMQPENRGATPAEIGRNTIESIYRRTEAMDLNSSLATAECTICISNYVDGESVRRLRCFHMFHTKCVDNWLKDNRLCPVCRTKLEEEG